MKRIRHLFSLFALAGLLGAAACGGPAPSPTATIMPTDTAAPTATVWPPAGTIAFSQYYTEGGEGEDIYSIQTDGTGLTRLTHQPGTYMGSPAWSPDGTRIAFDSGEAVPSSYAVWSMNADGSGKVQLSHLPVMGILPTWSPDGKQIAFCGRPQAIDWFHIYTMNADGSTITPVTSGEADDLFPAWASDGRILFIRLPRHVILGDVFAVNPDGSGEVQLTQKGTFRGFTVSPDAKSLAVFDYVLHRIVKIATAPPGDEVTLVEGFYDCDDLTLAWSPDGKALAVGCKPWSELAKPSALTIVNADGSGSKKIENAGLIYDPDWRP